MKLIVTILLTAFALTIASGQKNEFKFKAKLFSGTNYYLNNNQITKSQVEKSLAENPTALSNFKKANKNFATARVISSVGGVLIALEVVNLITGKQINERRPLLAVAIIAISVPIHTSGIKKMKKVVDFYADESIGVIPYQNKASSTITIVSSGTGVGLGLTF